ncbi:MAG: iron ABC transporter permease [Syntrophaceae bacterium]|nr:iron ABC transporter permease [Syntrophaceae bacterium]
MSKFLLRLLRKSPPVVVPVNDRPQRPPATPVRIVRVSLLLACILVLCCILALSTGSSKIDFLNLLQHLFLTQSDMNTGLDPAEETILFSIRLPRILFAAIVGAALSLSGVIFQALLRNPLADPYILGISGGAALGAIIGIIIGAGFFPMGIPGLAFLGALITIILVFGVAGSKSHRSGNTLLLTGVIINAFFSALIMFLVSISSSDRLQSVLFWLMGNLSLAESHDVMWAGLIVAAGFVIIYYHARPLNLLILGEETAMQLGVDAKRSQQILLVTASLVTAVAVSLSGTIGFIGLVIPHLLRLLLGADHRLLLPASALFGATFLVVADTLARTVMAPVELPVGVITALCGAPYFLYLLHRRTV